MRKLLILSLLLLPLILHGATPKLPSDKELKALAFDSLFAFNKAVQEKSFARFYEERLSSEFRKQYSLEKFAATFQPFIVKGYDISNIAKSEPVFDSPPAIDSDGFLVLKGHYDTRPNKVTFNLTCAYESSAWKLMGIDVHVTPEDAGKVPTNKELKKLVLDSLLLFNVAVQTKSFDDFYGHTAKLWQVQTSPEKLRKVFESFIDKKINIALITKEEPAFDETAVNADGLLVLKGSYPTQPKVSFELKYVYESESWKLFGINLEVKPTADKSIGKKADDSDDDEKDKDNEPDK